MLKSLKPRCGEALGKIDDIEEVLNALGQEFDIVDVEWPEEPEDETSDIDPALNSDVYDNEEENKNKTKKGEEVNKKIPDSDVTEGAKFLSRFSNDDSLNEAVSFAFSNNKVAKEVVFILNEFGITLSSEMFMTMLKKVHLQSIKNMGDEEKTAIIQFAHKIRMIANNKAVPSSEKVEESYDFESKFRSKIEHMIFTVVKYLILGRDEQDLSAFIKPQMYSEFSQIIKTSKFKQQAFRQTLRNFMFKANLLEEISSDFEIILEDGEKTNGSVKKSVSQNANRDEKQTKQPLEKSSTEKAKTDAVSKKPDDVTKPKKKLDKVTTKPAEKSNLTSVEKVNKDDFEKNATYRDLAKKDKNIKLAVDILKWMGFTEEVLDNSTVKMELRHNVRSRIKRIMTTPEAKRVKMLWSYELEKAIEEAQWTDTESLANDELEGLSDTDLKKGSVVKNKFSLPDSIDYKPWKFNKDKELGNTSFDNGEVVITFNAESIEKIVKAVNDEKKAFVVKDTNDIKWVFTQNSEVGGIFVVQQGKTSKQFLTPLDIEHLLK
jgi:hypothetical protein